VEIERLLRRINAVRPNEERIELNALMKIINGIRRDGYMFSKHIIVQDAGVIAVLLPKSSPAFARGSRSFRPEIVRISRKTSRTTVSRSTPR
jgi:hypothetical protein